MTQIENGDSGLSVRTKLNAALATQPYATRATFIAATVPADTQRTAFIVNGQSYAVIRDASGPIVQANGQKWRPDGDITPQHFGAVGDGVTDDTVALQEAVNFISLLNGGELKLPAGTISFSRIEMKSGVYIVGQGYDVTRLKQIIGTNADAIWSNGDISKFGLERFELDGSYFTSNWNAATGTTGNTSGGGLRLKAYACVIDIGLTNIAGIGAYFQEPDEGEVSAISDYISTVSLVGKDYGKEALIIEGPNDWILKKAWLGRPGILPRPAGQTMIAMSDVYLGNPADGIVLDNVNIEIGNVHVFAAWSGCGFRTRNTVRLTKGGRIISESCRSQVQISANTYGSAMFDVRRLGLLHPNWSATVPTYSGPDSAWDAVTIDANNFDCEVTLLRSITDPQRVVGLAGLVVNGRASVQYSYGNSIAPVGDSEAGNLYSGHALVVTGAGAKIDTKIERANGNAVRLLGQGNNIDFSAINCVNSAVLHRDSLSNSQRGNIVRGSIVGCDIGFNSVGTPTSERVDLTMELAAGKTPFTGDIPDLNKGQMWDISASVANADFSTRKFLQGALVATDTSARTLTLAHEFLYTPDYRQVQVSLDDRATPSLTPPEYLVVNNIDATNITIAYKYATTPDAAANHRVNVRVG
jgi:hypothetical protein